MDEIDDAGAPLDLNPVVRDAYKKFKRCADAEATFRRQFIMDLKFAEADAYNGWQWPDEIKQLREVAKRPCLTINKTRQHNLQIINDAKQNKPGIQVRPVGDGASKQSADVFEGVIRRIEYHSNASVAYDTATEFQVKAGLGYWRVVVDYAGDNTFDQEIYIRRVKNPLSIYLDPDIKEKDGSDATYGFVFDDLTRDEVKKEYKEYEEVLGDTLFNMTNDWVDKDHVRVAEFYRVKEVDDKLVSYLDQNGQRQTVRKGTLTKALFTALSQEQDIQLRPIKYRTVEWYLIIGNKVVEETTWLGQYIPIVRVIGEETEIEGRIDRKGHTRALLDPQRMYNYWTSSATEHVALQGKTPWIGDIKAFEGYEELWKTANTENHAYLPFNGYDDDGARVIPPPERPRPPEMAPAYLSGMQSAAQEMMFVSGQYQAQMGEQGNERSAKAISERQRQGDNATYHYIDNLATAVRFTGKILIDLIPKIYDTSRVIRILAEDGSELEVSLDPQQQQALQQQVLNTQGEVKRIFNPSVGKYDVMADIGPAYATKRQEAFNALSQILTQAPNLVALIGDILFKAADFPMAEEAAERMKRMVPPQALGQGPTANEQALQQQVQQLQAQIADFFKKAAIDEIKLKGKGEMRDIDAYNAETQRLKVISPAMGPEEIKALVQQLLSEALQTQLSPILAANAPDLGAAGGGAPTSSPAAAQPGQGPGLQALTQAGAKQAPDGHWYVQDPTRAGKYMRINFNGQAPGQASGQTPPAVPSSGSGAGVES